jgi:hypothetical protein
LISIAIFFLFAFSILIIFFLILNSLLNSFFSILVINLFILSSFYGYNICSVNSTIGLTTDIFIIIKLTITKYNVSATAP